VTEVQVQRKNEILLDDIYKAMERIRGFAFRTPAYRAFSEQNLWLKLECFQPVRSFKIRGASNKIDSIPVKEREERGIITASSGNHGLAVAYVANLLRIKATIVLPETVIQDKLEWIQSLGARTILHGRQQDERAKKAEEIMQKEGQIFIQPFNDTAIIAGQGTCALEIFEDVPDADSIFVPIGGGGLISGIAACAKLSDRKTKIVGVQPEGSPSMYQSWKAGQVSTIQESRTIADGLSVRKPGDITFSFVKRYVDDIMLVSDEEILSATRQLLQKEHVLAEPSGAAALAGFLKSKDKPEKSVAIVSGGNISRETLAKLVSEQKS
jgi:threonine dehydratase